MLEIYNSMFRATNAVELVLLLVFAIAVVSAPFIAVIRKMRGRNVMRPLVFCALIVAAALSLFSFYSGVARELLLSAIESRYFPRCAEYGASTITVEIKDGYDTLASQLFEGSDPRWDWVKDGGDNLDLRLIKAGYQDSDSVVFFFEDKYSFRSDYGGFVRIRAGCLARVFFGKSNDVSFKDFLPASLVEDGDAKIWHVGGGL